MSRTLCGTAPDFEAAIVFFHLKRARAIKKMQAVREAAQKNKSNCRVEITGYGVSYLAGGFCLCVISSTSGHFNCYAPWGLFTYDATIDDVLAVIDRMNNLTGSEIRTYIADATREYDAKLLKLKQKRPI